MIKSIAFFLLAASSACFAGIVGVNSPLSVSLGTTFEADVKISFQDLYGFQLDFSFNPTILQVISVTEGPFLQQGGQTTFFDTGTIDNKAGTISSTFDTLVTAAAGISGVGVIYAVQFQAISAGVSVFTISNGNGGFIDSNFNNISYTAAPASTTVTALTSVHVPEASTTILAPLGLVAVLCLRRCRLAIRGLLSC